jgi:hypothetical protein
MEARTLLFGYDKMSPRDIYKNRSMLDFTATAQQYFLLIFLIFPQNQC